MNTSSELLRKFALSAGLLLVTLLFGAAKSHAIEYPGTQRIAKALELIEEFRSDEAYDLLDMIPPESQEYRFAFVEMQKLHYRQGQWEKFFGFAAYYRQELSQKFNEPTLLFLETLALARHCQFSAAQKVFESVKRSAKDQKTVQSIEDLVFLSYKMPGNVDSIEKRQTVSAFSSKPEWKVDEERRSAILKKAVRNPRALRVYVPNLCEQEQKRPQS